jgi:hypothetical protein
MHPNHALRQFFSGPLKQFEKTETVTTIRGNKLTRLRNADIIEGEFSTTVIEVA